MQNKKTRHQFHLPPALSEKLDRLSRQPGAKKSDIIARAVEAFIDRRGESEIDQRYGQRLDRLSRYLGQSRALLVWQRIVMPDGSSVQIDNLPATDAAGYAGLEDEVDYHTWALIKGVAISTMLGVGTQLSLGSNESDLVRALRESTQQNVAQVGQRITEKNLNIQPTITIRPGWPVRVIVHKDIVLKPYRGG